MKIIVNKYTIYKKVWISYHHLIKAEFEHCFWNILEFGFIWIACDCMFVLFSLSHPCMVYLKSKEANELSLGSLHALVSSEHSVMVQEKFIPKLQTSLDSWGFFLELEVETEWLPHMFPNKQNKMNLKNTGLFRGDKEVCFKIKPFQSRREFISCHPEVFFRMKFYLICSALLLRHASLRFQHRWKLRSDFFPPSNIFVILCLFVYW